MDRLPKSFGHGLAIGRELQRNCRPLLETAIPRCQPPPMSNRPRARRDPAAVPGGEPLGPPPRPTAMPMLTTRVRRSQPPAERPLPRAAIRRRFLAAGRCGAGAVSHADDPSRCKPPRQGSGSRTPRSGGGSWRRAGSGWCGSGARSPSIKVQSHRHREPLPRAAIRRRLLSAVKVLGLVRLRTLTIQHGPTPPPRRPAPARRDPAPVPGGGPIGLPPRPRTIPMPMLANRDPQFKPPPPRPAPAHRDPAAVSVGGRCGGWCGSAR